MSRKRKGLLEELISSLEAQCERYAKELEHVKKCKAMLAEAASSGDFSEQELIELKAAVERRTGSVEPLLAQLTDQIQLAQKEWRRKQNAIASVGSILEPAQLDEWNAAHNALADRLDKLIDQL